MIPTAAVIILALATTGCGAAILQVLGQWQNRCALERAFLAFAVGFGGISWLLFWIGIAGFFTQPVIWGVSLLLAFGNFLHRLPAEQAVRNEDSAPAFLLWGLFALFLVALAFDFIEGLAPPADGDTLAYHFTLPKEFMREGRIFFVPRVFDGAIPLLIHMTYTAALVLGGGGTDGTIALTGWSFVSGWMASGLLFAFGLRWLPVSWSLAVALLFQTLPAMVYGAGSGQVEARMALFVLTAVVGLVDARRLRTLGPLVLVGLGAGFYAASKYLGLLFVLTCIAAVLFTGRGRIRRLIVFGAVTAIAGFQWYFWNFIHTGDPIFPFMFNIAEALGLANHEVWTPEFAADFKNYIDHRGSTTRELHWFLTYPIVATLFPVGEMQSGRVGLGPFFLLALPPVAIGLWVKRKDIKASPLFPVAVMIGVFYLLWIQYGVIPKVRHILPVLPAILLCMTVAGVASWGRVGLRPLGLAMLLSLGVNYGAHGLYSKEYLRYLATGMDSEVFLERNLFGYDLAKAINAVPDVSAVYIEERHLQYYVKARTFFSAAGKQMMIDNREGHIDPNRLATQLKQQNISHLAVHHADQPPEPRGLRAAVRALSAKGCLIHVETVDYNRYLSRTLKNLTLLRSRADIWRLNANCEHFKQE